MRVGPLGDIGGLDRFHPFLADPAGQLGVNHGRHHAGDLDAAVAPPQLFDLEADPEENAPITKGEALDEMSKKYREVSKGVREIVPWACAAGCLNRAYMNKP